MTDYIWGLGTVYLFSLRYPHKPEEDVGTFGAGSFKQL